MDRTRDTWIINPMLRWITRKLTFTTWMSNEPRSTDSHSNALPIELIGRYSDYTEGLNYSCSKLSWFLYCFHEVAQSMLQNIYVYVNFALMMLLITHFNFLTLAWLKKGMTFPILQIHVDCNIVPTIKVNLSCVVISVKLIYRWQLTSIMVLMPSIT